MKRYRFYIMHLDGTDANYTFDAPNSTIAVHIGRGMAFADGWCCENTSSELEELD